MADNETIADIIAEMRGMGNYQRYSGDHARVLAGRLEAAYKREKAAIEADALEVGGIVEAAWKRELGDAAKLRVALETLRELLGDLLRLGDAEYHNDFSNFCDIIDAALSAPPRNCDVGSAEEQSDRMDAVYCSKRLCAKGKCPLFKPGLDCSLIWAQMPYEEGGDK